MSWLSGLLTITACNDMLTDEGQEGAARLDRGLAPGFLSHIAKKMLYGQEARNSYFFFRLSRSGVGLCVSHLKVNFGRR